MRQQSDWQRQAKGAYQYEQMLKAREKEQHERWQTNPCDTLGCEPDFPGDVRE